MLSRITCIFLSVFMLSAGSVIANPQRWIIAGDYKDALLFIDRNAITNKGLEFLIYYRDGFPLADKKASYKIQIADYNCSLKSDEQLIKYEEPKYFDGQNNRLDTNLYPLVSNYRNVLNGGFNAQIYAQGCSIANGSPADGDERVNSKGQREIYLDNEWQPLKGENVYYYVSIDEAIEFSRYSFNDRSNKENKRISIYEAVAVDSK